MPGLLSGGKPLKGTTGSTSIFITLPTAQLNLGITPTTNTGYTLVTGPAGQLGWTATLGSILFRDSVITANNSNSNLTITSNGTGSVILSGNVLINSKQIISTVGSFTNLLSRNATLTNLTVTGSFLYSSATSTATFASSVQIQNDLRVDRQFNAYGNVSLSPQGGIVDIRPQFGGTVLIRPGDLGSMDNVNIGQIEPANGRFIYLTATNLTVENFTVAEAIANTGTFQKIRVLSTASDAITVAGGMTVTNAIVAGSVFDNGKRVISTITVGPGLSISTTTGPSVVMTNTGVTKLIAGTDTNISTSTGDITIWSFNTLQSVTNNGWTTTNFMHIQNGFSQIGTGSNSIGGTWTDAVFVVDGDAGIGGNLYINGDFYASGKSVLTTSSVGGAILGGDDIVVVTTTATGELTFNDISTLQSVTGRGHTSTFVVHFANTTNSTSTTTGAIRVDGGIGVAKDVHVGGDVYSAGGSPAYNYKLYTPQITVSTSTPVGSRIGDFWIDPSIGVEYQYVPNGTQTVWIQFIGF